MFTKHTLTTTDSKHIFTQQGTLSASSQTTRFHSLVIKFFLHKRHYEAQHIFTMQF